MTFHSCGTMKINKLLKVHNSVLSEVANSNMDPQEKMDVLGESFVKLINESLSFVNPKNSIKHFDQYAKVDKNEINLIMKSVEDWQEGMSSADQLFLIANLATKSYSKDLINLLPKLEKKIDRSVKTINFLSKFVSILKPKF